ncbi:MAG: hypothetical protein JNK87_12525 [Bryobacterales bacterium]|nr:hypothetical protein [Bryobacterales bacterium]
MPHFRVSGLVWQVELSNEEANNVSGAAGAVAGSTAPFAPVAAVALAALAGVIVTVNQIGGGQGVNVVGVVTTQFVTITPRFVSPVGLVSAFAQAVHAATGLPGGVVGAGLGAGLALLATGPAGVVVGGFAGAIGAVIGGGGGANPGDVHADRALVGPWEKFLLVTLTPNNVAISSWRGFFCAENGGGGPVHANRPHIRTWETHTLLRNPNGTVSFRSSGGHFLVAESGGGSVCNWNRTAIGPWEQFWMEFQGDGSVALKTFQGGRYVSVQ